MVRTASYRPSGRMFLQSGQVARPYTHIGRARTRRINVRPTRERLGALASATRAPLVLPPRQLEQELQFDEEEAGLLRELMPPPPPQLVEMDSILPPVTEEFTFDTSDEQLLQAEASATAARAPPIPVGIAGEASRTITELIGHPQSWTNGNWLSTAAKLFLRRPVLGRLLPDGRRVGRFTHDNGDINHNGQGVIVFFLLGNGISPSTIRKWFVEKHPISYRIGSANYKDIEHSIWDYVIHQRKQFVLLRGRSVHERPFWFNPQDLPGSRRRLRELL